MLNIFLWLYLPAAAVVVVGTALPDASAHLVRTLAVVAPAELCR